MLLLRGASTVMVLMMLVTVDAKILSLSY